MSVRLVRQAGFTLIELVVSIAIIGVLAALLVPAVQSSRDAARRTVCKNQLRQLGLALHMYHEVHRCFPPGSYVMGPSFPMQSGWGWGAMALPYIEQSAIYEQINFGLGTGLGGNLSADRHVDSHVPLSVGNRFRHHHLYTDRRFRPINSRPGIIAARKGF